MFMDDVRQCGGPGCEQPLARQSTGRPPRYCSPRCRKAAQRERDRRAEVERWLPAAVAESPAAVAWTRESLELQIGRAGDLAAAVVEAAGGTDWDKLISVLDAYRWKAADVEIAARMYFDATDYAAWLAGQSDPAQTDGRSRPWRPPATRQG
jgi:hypothetical protein